MPADALLGPLAALAGALVVVGVLWREHLRADKADRDQRDQAMAGWREQTDANKRLAAAAEARNRRDAATKRANDP